ncbi:SDR family oxidoreductase [Microbacterium sp. No. 7]|uniref:SDR family oxidoreductase n=1 Tax=Microbacterium sp. No. 7 TaxID=1714373 RepID=UPI000A7E71E4|nr:SDR family oxidoreductase [Microbacterium sp. No. 7]
MTTPTGLPRPPQSYESMLRADALDGLGAVVLGEGPLASAVHEALAAVGASVRTELPGDGAAAAARIAELAPHILVTVPSTTAPARADDLDAESVARVVERDLTVPYNAILAVARAAGDRGAAIVSIVSSAAVTGAPGFAGPAAAQSSLCSAARSLAAEWAPRDIRVNTVSVGPFEGVRPDAAAGHVPAMRLGEPRELGWLVAYLVSPYAAYLTGAHIGIDGGDTLRRRLVGEPYQPGEFLAD